MWLITDKHGNYWLSFYANCCCATTIDGDSRHVVSTLRDLNNAPSANLLDFSAGSCIMAQKPEEMLLHSWVNFKLNRLI